MRGRFLAALAALLTLPGCNALALGAFALPAPSRPALGGRVFALTAQDLATPAPAAPEAEWPFDQPSEAPDEALAEPALAPGTGTAGMREVSIVGRVRVAEEATGIVNVREGYVTGTPIVMTDALTGRRLASAVTFYDGSFTFSLRVKASKVAAVVSTELLAADDPAERAVLSSPLFLRAGDTERRIDVTPGSTALTGFLRSLAAELGSAGTALPADPPDHAALVGPKFAGLIAGLDEEEHDSFVGLADRSSELAGATSLVAIRDGIDHFVGRLNPR